MLLVSCFPPSLGHSVVCGSCKFRKMKVSGRAAVQAASLIWIGVLDLTYSQADCGGSAWNRRRPLPCEDLGWTIALEVRQLPFLLRRPSQVRTQEAKAETGGWGWGRGGVVRPWGSSNSATSMDNKVCFGPLRTIFFPSLFPATAVSNLTSHVGSLLRSPTNFPRA